jgi:hypothetical protein
MTTVPPPSWSAFLERLKATTGRHRGAIDEDEYRQRMDEVSRIESSRMQLEADPAVAPFTGLPPDERAAVERVLMEIHEASVAGVDPIRVWSLLGVISAAARLTVSDLQHRAGPDQIHARADQLAENVAELQEGGEHLDS